MRRRALTGNEFIHFSIHAIATAKAARDRGLHVRCLLEHPEDLGRTHNGVPASIWQLEQLRSAFGDDSGISVAGHQ